MSTSGLAQVGVGTPAPVALGDALANPTTVDVAALQLTFNGATWDRRRLPNIYKSAAATAAGNTAAWTPAAGKKFRLQRLLVVLSGDSALAVAGRNVITVNDAGTAIGLTWESFMPAAALNNGGLLFSSGWLDLGAGYLSVAANNVLNLNLGTALTAGTARIIAAGTEE